MNFGFTAEQDLLRDQIKRFVADSCPSSAVRCFSRDPGAARAELWPLLSGLGCFGALIDEDHGGLGLKWVDHVVVLEELGRGLCPLPAIPQTLSILALARHGPSALRQQWLKGLIDGSRIMVPAWMDAPHRSAGAVQVQVHAALRESGHELTGTKRFVVHADIADSFLVAFTSDAHPGKICLGAVESGPSVTVRVQPSVDETKSMADLVLDRVTVAQDSILVLSVDEFNQLLDFGALATCAEALGAVEAALELTVQYARQRVQFGVPIGKFQGVKHPLANMYVDLESMKSLTYFAAWTADSHPAAFPKAVSLAKGFLGDAFNKMAVECVNLHGAMGFTAEYDIQLFLKRAKWVRPAFGDGQFHFSRSAALGTQHGF